MESWIFLLVGSVGAVGAAMVLGTGMALLRYHREGDFPGRPADAPPPDRRDVRLLYGRVVLGLVVAVGAVVALRSQGLL